MGGKKKIFFVIDSLGIGGAERSLVNLLQCLDYSKYEVDLQLFNSHGILSFQLPKEVNLLPVPAIISLLGENPISLFSKPQVLLKKGIYSLILKFGRISHAGKAALYWFLFQNDFKKIKKKYDVSIGYSQGLPTFFATDKVDAPKKLVWVNVDYFISGFTKTFLYKYYKKATRIVTVSQFVQEFFSKEVFPDLKNRMTVIRDLINPGLIEKMAFNSSDPCLFKERPIIMTVGRLNKPQKGYDLAIETAKILKCRNLKFVWYAIGEGGYRNELEKYIIDNDLKDYFILIGATSNPYAYMAQCDIYVQPSRHEGFGLTIAEALILNKPVVCTKFEGCTMQMIHKKNGLITSFNPKDIANAIELLINDKTLYSTIQEFLQNEKKGNLEEIEKFYNLIES